MRQGGEDLVKFLVALRLAALGAAAAPQQTHLELGLEDLVDFCLLLQACGGGGEQEVSDTRPSAQTIAPFFLSASPDQLKGRYPLA